MLQVFRQRIRWARIEGFKFLVLGFVVFTAVDSKADPATTNSAPSAPSINIPAATPEMTEFLQNRSTLMARMVQLQAQGAPTAEALEQFQQQNADLLQRQAQLGKLIAQQQDSSPVPVPPQLQMPPNASLQVKAFLAARDQLMRDEMAFKNLHLSDDPTTREAAMQQWRQQNAARLQQIQQMAKTLAQQQVASPLPVPPPLQMPPNASPEMQALLTARDQFARDEIAFLNQHMNDDQPTRDAALQQWRQQNTARLQQIQQLAQALPSTN